MPYAIPSPAPSVSPTTSLSPSTSGPSSPVHHTHWGPSTPQSWTGRSNDDRRASLDDSGNEQQSNGGQRAHSPLKRPSLRNHIRSQSHDALPTLAPMPQSMIFVHPASPNHPNGHRSVSESGPSSFGSSMTASNGYGHQQTEQTWPAEAVSWTPSSSSSSIGNDDSPSSNVQSPSVASPSTHFPHPLLNLRNRHSGPVASSSNSNGTALRLNLDSRRRTPSYQDDDSTPGARRRPTAAPMLRKKSGELVKSSLKTGPTPPGSSMLPLPSVGNGVAANGVREFRAKSVPTTPTGPKNVHFDTNLERVKHFFAQNRPTTISRSGSPEETETETEPEFAYPFPTMPSISASQLTLVADIPTTPDDGSLGPSDVHLESLNLVPELCALRGTVVVRNLAFHKRVVVRFTFDDWQTISEVAADHSASLRGGEYDRFQFSIKLQDLLSRIEQTKMLLAVRYDVNGRDYWDNNESRNYAVSFKRNAPQTEPRSRLNRAASEVTAGAKTYQWSVSTPHQAAERMALWRRQLIQLVADDADDSLDQGLPHAPQRPPTNATFANRYDFGASLKRNRGQTADGALMANPFFHHKSGLDSPSASPNSAAYQPLAPVHNSTNGVNFVGGMPATTYEPGPVQAPSAGWHRQHSGQGVISTDYAIQPEERNGRTEPFPPMRPESPDDTLAPLDMTPRSARFNSYPPSRGAKAEHRALLSPSGLLSPAATPPLGRSPNTSPRKGRSPVPSPSKGRSPASSPPLTGSPPAKHIRPVPGSPPPLVSPSSTDSTSQSSPQSPTRTNDTEVTEDDLTPSSSLPSLGQGGYFSDLPSYSGFLERYCWHQGGALGLTQDSGDPLPLDGRSTPRQAALAEPPRATGGTSCSATLISPRTSNVPSPNGPLSPALEAMQGASYFRPVGPEAIAQN